MNYKVIDLENYYRKDVFKRFSEGAKCSTSITSKIDVTDLVKYSKVTHTKFYINFLYLLAKVLNSSDDYKMDYLYKENKIICYDSINIAHYIFHEDTKTFSMVLTTYNPDYKIFYEKCLEDIVKAKSTHEMQVNFTNDHNYFEASYISWLHYDSLNIELPDGYLYLAPLINWGRYQEENGRLTLPLTVRMNHCSADGYQISMVYLKLSEEIKAFVGCY